MTELKQFPIPNLTEVLDLAKASLRATLNAVNIGIIEGFDATEQTASIRMAIKQIRDVAPDGTRFFVEHPVLLKCPMVFPSGGGFTLTFPIAVGDECVVLFNDRELDNWFFNGGVQAPTTKRSHDLSDAIAIVGLRSKPRSLVGVSTAAAQLRSNDGSTLVEVAGGGIVRVVAPTKIQLDTPVVEITGIINVQNANSVAIPCTINGDISTNGDVIATGISLVTHVHSGVQSGMNNTGAPV